MKVAEVMSRDLQIASPNDTLQDAAATMKRIDAGVLPVGAHDKLVGMITDCDIAILDSPGGPEVGSRPSFPFRARL